MTIKNLLNILRMNQKALTMICLKIILIWQQLLFRQKKVHKTKNKKENNKLVELINVRWNNLKDEIEKMSEDKKTLKNQIKYRKLLKKFLILIK